ncbi:replication protein [Raoultella ornithinolytica]|uniref:replication protein n=1 Tax=Raoultella ornithinolytica TaxID=54291 RepID=UPI000FEBDCE7|nr:replication protein [Raoultella ornithinolytica]EJG2381875.1 replication protein [Raoultella ornithinolytica]MCF6660668.1 replication protein [Raoultella ornithinolytica]MCF6685226.1 replication protein [Raoultella ornithinolytica]RWS98616.1 replication protein [Raoultella ornithinolytica]HEQ3497196.1 replication protein [Raoultella ornithinolytica]
MANTAEVINFPVPVVALQELRVADLDDGFTRIANELLEAVMLAGLSQHQLLVFLAVMRKTYGFNKKSDWVSNEQISLLTGILPHKCSAAKSALVKRGIFTQSGRIVGINKVVGEWSSLPVIGKENKDHLKEVNSPESGKESIPESGNGYYPNQVNTKDKHTKDNKDIKDNSLFTREPPDSQKPKKQKKRASQFPEGFAPNAGNQKLALELGVNLQSEVSAFSDHHQSKGSTFKDWNLALNTWLRNAVKFGRRAQPVQRQFSQRSEPENFAAKDYGQTEIPSWARD